MDPTQPKILVIEDDLIGQKVLQLLLGAFECKIDVADTGQKALTLIAENNYELIFMDIGLPDANGLDLCEKLLSSETQTKNLKIVIVSAYSDTHYQSRLESLGLDHILKPMTAEKCQNILSKYVPTLKKQVLHE